MKFLETVAKDIISKTKNNRSFIVVLPNNRSITYFRAYYYNNIQQATWAPNITTIEKLFYSLTNYKIDNNISLLFNLYEAFNKVFKNSKDFGQYTLDEFMPLGQTILNDFDQIDNYLIDPQKIYQNIADYQSIDFTAEYLDQEQKKIINEFLGIISKTKLKQNTRISKLAKNLPEVYKIFKQRLLKQGALYPGLLKRTVVENKNNIPISYKKYFFVGFYALTKTEHELMQFIKKNAEAYFYWDYDDFYLKDPNNEAGYFLRKNIEYFGQTLNTPRNNILNSKKNIKTIAFPQDILQAKAIPYIFEQLKLKDNPQDLSETVIVLTKENMLLPVLNSIPKYIPKINITLGYPIKNTPLYSLIDNWLKLLLQLKNKNKVNVELLLLILKNPLIYNYLIKSEQLIEQIKNKKTKYLSDDILSEFKENFLKTMFNKQNIEDFNTFLKNFLNLLYTLFWNSQASNDRTIGEFIYNLYTKINNLKNFLEEKNIKQFNIQVAFLFIRQILAEIQVPFTGKTIEGLQITTMLETRNLDFKNVIILNLNENIYPAVHKKPSLISEFIRAGYGLPLLKYQDSVFAYFFYRLIQNAENIFLLYNNSITSNSNEKSRFIQQLEYQTNLITQKLSFADKTVPQTTIKQFSAPKNQTVIAQLNKYLNKERYFSASALNTYLDCPLKFYYRYIANIPELQEFQIDIDTAQFGSIVHLTMEKLYQPYKKQLIDYKIFKQIEVNLDKIFKQATEEITQTEQKNIKQGINKLALEVAKEEVKILLKYDQKKIPFKIIDLEQQKITEIKLNSGKSIKLKAIFDRVEEKDEIIRLIDYKTGNDTNYITKLSSVFDKNNTSTHAIFQMLLYTYIHKENKKIVQPQLYVIRQMNKKNFNPNINIGKTILTNRETELLNEFVKLFEQLIEEIFDTTINFLPSQTLKPCSFCPYKYLCGR